MKPSEKHLKKLIFTILGDVVLFAAFILTFCWFHHAGKMLGFTGKNATVPTEEVIAKPSPSATEKQTTPAVTPTGAALPTGQEQPGLTSAPTATPLPTPTPECDENGVPYDFSGDFGAKFGKLFSADNTIVTDDTSYRSHDVYIKMSAFDGNLSQRTSKGAERFAQSHTVWYAFDVYVRNIENFFTSYSRSGEKQFSALYKDTSFGNAVAAINGDLFLYYDETKKVIVRNGSVIRTSDYIVDDICVLYWDGAMEIETHDTYDWNRIKERAPYQIWSFGPSLIAPDGSVNKCYDSVIWIKNPRAAVGMVEPGHYVLLAVAGYRADAQRTVNGDGITLEAVGELMASLGCKVAYNLDGGASVYAGFNGKELFHVTNASGSTRTISDILCIGECIGKDGAE